MTLLEASQIAGAASLLVAAAIFFAAQINRTRRARQERIQKWQKVVVFRLIVDGESDFNTLRLSYLASVLKFEEKLPKSDLQDATLQLLLMQLLADELVTLTETNQYVARRALAQHGRRNEADAQGSDMAQTKSNRASQS